MSHRIEVDVVEMRCKVAITPDEVLPVSPLPDRSLAAQAAAQVILCLAKARDVLPSEAFLDEAPTRWVVAIVVRKRPQRVKMVGQDDLRLDDERTPLLYALDCVMKHGNGLRMGEQRPPLIGNDSEEISGASHG
jgi:hypothetical protein